MTDIPFATSDYRRGVARAPDVLMRNRFFEANPVLNDGKTGLLGRPGGGYFLSAGTGPIRSIYSAPGAFDGKAFFVSGLDLWSVDFHGVTTNIGTIGVVETDGISWAATANIGATPGHLFVSDGGILWCYTDVGYAIGDLTASAIADTDVVKIDTTYYQFTSGSVDAGTPAGTVGSPWLVALGGTVAASLTNLFNAINDSGGGTVGTDYSSAITPHPTVIGYNFSSTDLFVQARINGTGGNAISTTETGAGTAWAHTTLTGGGSPSLLQVYVPGDVGAISLGFINSYAIVVPSQGHDINGRFYWIQPGEITIDPLDFATAERSPDAVFQVIVYSDLFWLLGENTTEAWQTTGDPNAPMLRVEGVLFDRGVWEGTGIQVKDSLMLVDSEGAVFQNSRNGVNRVSSPDIEERIRRAIQRANLAYS